MSQIKVIVDQLNRAFDGEAWHGPALMEILEGIDAKTAAARPIPAAHTIWELVLHLAGWERVVTRRLHGEKLTLSDEDNFPRINDTGEKAWQEAITSVRHTHHDLVAAVSELGDSRLSEAVPGKEYDVLHMLYGVVQHTAYHGGQIGLLKKAAA